MMVNGLARVWLKKIDIDATIYSIIFGPSDECFNIFIRFFSRRKANENQRMENARLLMGRNNFTFQKEYCFKGNLPVLASYIWSMAAKEAKTLKSAINRITVFYWRVA